MPLLDGNKMKEGRERKEEADCISAQTADITLNADV
jgi:hypothetical protein